MITVVLLLHHVTLVIVPAGKYPLTVVSFTQQKLKGCMIRHILKIKDNNTSPYPTSCLWSKYLSNCIEDIA